MAEIHKLKTENVEPFEEFWKAYPLKKGKAKAREIFNKIISEGGYDTKSLDRDSGTYIDLHLEASATEIIDAAKGFWKTFPQKGAYSFERDLTYCPHATTWLNQGRWED